MRKHHLAALLLALLLTVGLTACGKKEEAPEAAPADAQTFTGTVQENKLFMITLEDDEGNAYVFNTDAIGEDGMEPYRAGDTVTATYTGDLEEVGTVLTLVTIQQAE